MDIHRSRVTVVARSPRPIEQLPSRPRSPGVAGKDRQQVELLRSQVDDVAVAAQLVRDKIQLAAVGHGKRPLGTSTRALLEQRESSGELARGNRARQGVIEAEAQRVESRVDGFGSRKVDHAETVAAPPLASEQLPFRGAARWGPQQRDPRPGTLEQGNERLDIRHYPYPAAGQRGQLEGRPVCREREPLERGRGIARTLVDHGPRVGPRR